MPQLANKNVLPLWASTTIVGTICAIGIGTITFVVIKSLKSKKYKNENLYIKNDSDL